MSLSITLTLSLLGGIFPALLWLWFWLKEDRLHPEPKLRLFAVFLSGMTAVLLALPIERFVFTKLLSEISTYTIILWAIIEELLKFGAAYLSGLRGKDADEPIDMVIYMITAALGFSALENTLFISNLISENNFAQSIIMGNTRFLGATLLHVACSAFIGVMMGIAFYKKAAFKKIFLFTGILASIILHTIFNLLIIKVKDEIFFVFAGVWILIIVLVVLIEKVKAVRLRSI